MFAYHNYDTISLFGHEYQNGNNEPLIFYIERESGNFTYDEQCLEPAEMNFHFWGEKEVIYNILPVELNKPANWTFMECELEGIEEASPIIGNPPCIHHQNRLTYALRFLLPVAGNDPPVEL